MTVERKQCLCWKCSEYFYDFTKNRSKKYCCIQCKREEEFRIRRMKRKMRLSTDL